MAPGLRLASEVGTVFWNRALNLQGLRRLWAVSVRTELNCWTLLASENRCWDKDTDLLSEKTHTFGVGLKTPQDAEGVVTTDIYEPGSGPSPEPAARAPDLTLPNCQK